MNVGVRGTASGSEETNVGVFGTAHGGDLNLAGYFDDGDVYVKNSLGIGAFPDYPLTVDTYERQASEIKSDYYGTGSGVGLIVRSINNNASGGINYGSSAYASSYNSPSSSYGAWFRAEGTSTGTKYGLYADATGAGTLYAGYFAGDVYTTGSYLPSDRKLKDDIEDVENALDIVNGLKARTYTYKTEEFEKMKLQEGQRYGFVAEEMKEVLPQFVKKTRQDYSGPADSVDLGHVEFEAVNYVELIPILTAAIQEQQKEIESIKPENAVSREEFDALKAENEVLREMIQEILENQNRFDSDLQQCCFNYEENGGASSVIQSASEESGSDSPVLEQNAPNPFRKNSVIKYYLPSSTRSAELIITDLSGAQLKAFNLQGAGFGQVLISGGSFDAGTYLYTLILNGERIASKQMILL